MIVTMEIFVPTGIVLFLTAITTVFAEIITNEGVGGPVEWIPSASKPAWLQCNETNDPSANFVWFKDGEEVRSTDPRYRTSDTNNTINVNGVQEADGGTYRCALAKQTSIYRDIVVYTKPRSWLELKSGDQRSVSIVEGDTLTLKCQSAGNPMPKVTWRKDGVDIIGARDKDSSEERGSNKGSEEAGGSGNATSGRIRIVTERNETFYRQLSTLTITNVEDSDRAVYMCYSDTLNGVSSHNSTVLVRVKDKLAALWPFLGIIAEVVVLCTIIFIYEKRRSKQEVDESDTDQSPDTKNPENKDLRQRK